MNRIQFELKDTVISGITSDQVVTKSVTCGGARGYNLQVKVSGVAQTGTITVQLQDSFDNSEWRDVSSITISTDGYQRVAVVPELELNTDVVPLATSLRFVITTTNAADEVTIDAIHMITF